MVNSFNTYNVPCRPIAHHEVEKKQSALRYVRIETAIALFCSFLINLFIVSVFAKVCINLYRSALLHSQGFAPVCLSVCLSVCLCLSLFLPAFVSVGICLSV